MNEGLKRLLNPKTIALVGGAWTDAVANASRQIGYQGTIWRIHPTRPSDETTHYYRSVDELPAAPDATFLAAPCADVPAVAASLAARGAGGFVCFAAGFDETGTDAGHALTEQLVTSAGDLPFTGPNCYGLVNFFDRVALWPDQVVGGPPKRGVVLITQSGTIGLSLMYNHRSLPIGYVLTVGNQTRLAMEDLIDVLCEDPRVSAFGLYVEGIKDAERFAAAVAKARRLGKPVALVKSGRTEAAARTAATHTGALAGADSVFDAFCRDAGIARCDTLPTLIETLKVLHAGGPLSGRKLLVMGASGGDMAMTADVSRELAIEFPPMTSKTVSALTDVLGPRVTIANPFDFHTYIWFDQERLRRLFTEVFQAGYDAVAFMLDCPPPDQTDTAAYDMPIREFVAAATRSNTRGAMLASLPETLYTEIRQHCLEHNVVPLQGQREGLEALALAAAIGEAWRQTPPPELRKPSQALTATRTLDEHEGKAALAVYGVPVPTSHRTNPADAAASARSIGFPVVLKAVSATLAHKSDVGGVILNVKTEAEATIAAKQLAALSNEILVEQMIVDGVAEVLVGITVDPQFGQILVLGSGGVMTEYLKDSTSLLPPFTEDSIARALNRLRIARLLAGFRGKAVGDVPALIQAILAVTRYAQANVETLSELDVNPMIVRPLGLGVVAVDALIRI